MKDNLRDRILKTALVVLLNLAIFAKTIPDASYIPPQFHYIYWPTFFIWPSIVLYFWIKGEKKTKIKYALAWPGLLLGFGLVVFLALLSFAGI